ncbi:MAG: tetratricopeptide repeat protein [Planctomycetes bacterium]|nr:tetratricopeptide repeat protein [Planctomycetota bacterium]
MTTANRRRLALYTAALVVVAALSALALEARARAARDLIGTLQNGGELMVRVGLHDRAEEYARRILEMDADHVGARLLLGCCGQQTGRFDDAIREYEEALKRTEAPAQRQYLELVLADMHRLKKDYAGARARLERYRAWGNEGPDLFMVEGELHADLGEHAEAAACFRRAASADPPAEGASMALAREYFRLGDKPGSLAALEAVAAGTRRTHGVWYAIAELRRDLGDREGALEALRSALASEPGATRRRLETDREAWGALVCDLGTDPDQTGG